MVVVVIVLSIVVGPVALTARADQLDGSLERFQCHLRTSGAKGEVEAFPLPGASQRNRELRFEFPTEG
jgi:hypothetical protein